jgi:hypothetical protein
MGSINSQFRSDLKAARELWLPWRALLLLFVCFIPVFALFKHYELLNVAVPVTMCFSVFGLLIYLKWSLRRQPLFWATIAVLAAAHAALIWYIPWTTKWVPAVTVTSIVTIDFCLMLWVLAAVDSWLGSQSDNEN